MLSKKLALFCLFGCVVVSVTALNNRPSGSVLADLVNEEVDKKVFEEQTKGLDGKSDIFYYVDDQVNELFARKKYTNGLLTLGGQATDALGTSVLQSTYPFAVGQLSTKGMKTSAERWDIKDTGSKTNAEFFAIYHGDGNPFVVNKVRAHLLRKFANSLQDYVPILEYSMQQETDESRLNKIHDEVRKAIETIFQEVDFQIRANMYEKDDSSATATIVMVTPSAVVTAAIGQGQVIGYDEESRAFKLTNYIDDEAAKNLFGSKKSRPASLVTPHVEIHSRVSRPIQLLLIESPTVYQNTVDYQAFRTVVQNINAFKRDPTKEQQIYSDSVSQILNSAKKNIGGLSNLVKAHDLTVTLIGLNTNYENIH